MRMHIYSYFVLIRSSYVGFNSVRNSCTSNVVS